MLAPRACSVLLALLAPACFSPSGSDIDTAGAPTSSTDTTTTTTGTSTTATTATTAVEPTTSGATTTTTSDTATTGPAAPTTTDATTTSTTTLGTTSTTTDDTTEPMTTTLPAGECGNGVVEPGEECDDGNPNDNDECTNSCLEAICGDGVVYAGVEECDAAASYCDDCKRLFWRVFVSSKTDTGDLEGLAGADAMCQSLATEAGLGGTFKAWLSTDSESAATRLTHSDLPYKRLDDALVANNWAGLVAADIANPIVIDEKGSKVADGDACRLCPVWTATNQSGAGLSEDCNDWNTGFGNSSIGECTATDARWTTGCGPYQCSWQARIYCFEQ